MPHLKYLGSLFKMNFLKQPSPDWINLNLLNQMNQILSNLIIKSPHPHQNLCLHYLISIKSQVNQVTKLPPTLSLCIGFHLQFKAGRSFSVVNLVSSTSFNFSSSLSISMLSLCYNLPPPLLLDWRGQIVSYLLTMLTNNLRNPVHNSSPENLIINWVKKILAHQTSTHS
jgi:hypothetical protein